MKYLMSLILTAALWVSTGFSGSCYEVWIAAYYEVSDVYNANMGRCERALFRHRCEREAEAIYSNALGKAGDDFYDC